MSSFTMEKGFLLHAMDAVMSFKADSSIISLLMTVTTLSY